MKSGRLIATSPGAIRKIAESHGVGPGAEGVGVGFDGGGREEGVSHKHGNGGATGAHRARDEIREPETRQIDAYYSSVGGVHVWVSRVVAFWCLIGAIESPICS